MAQKALFYFLKLYVDPFVVMLGRSATQFYRSLLQNSMN